MTFNQILKSRHYLKPVNGVRNIVGYLDKTWPGQTIYYDDVYASYDDFNECPLCDEDGKPKKFRDINEARVNITACGAPSSPLVYVSGFNASVRVPMSGTATATQPDARDAYNYLGRADGLTQAQFAIAMSDIASDDEYVQSVRDAITEYEFGNPAFARWNDSYDAFNGNKIRIGDNFYTVSVVNYIESSRIGLPEIYKYTISAWLNLTALNYSNVTDENNAENIFQYINAIYHEIRFTKVTVTGIPLYNRNHIDEVPYDIFVIPDSKPARKFVGYLASQTMGSANIVYDIQILPFAPPTTSANEITIESGVVLRWATTDYGTDKFVTAPVISYSSDTSYKKGSNLEMCRLVSPDGSSAWDFNPAKIGGVDNNNHAIKYEITFAPFSVYMHIFPTFGGIYGTVNKTLGQNEESESRGLICRGDYSIPYSTSNWASYKVNNSAYQLSHDRQITNMSIGQEAERAMETLSIATGTVSGAIGGAMSGAMAGGAYGAVAGGVIGGAGTLIAGLAQREYNEKLRAEDISYTEDMFGYALQNIKAQAQPLAHTNSLTIGASWFPFIEVYGTTLVEEDIFEDRLRINGWSLGIVTTLSAMKTACSPAGSPTGFCKGRLVRYGGEEDSHLVNELNAELQRGVRFK